MNDAVLGTKLMNDAVMENEIDKRRDSVMGTKLMNDVVMGKPN